MQKSSGSERRQEAVLLRDQLLGKKARGETPDIIAAKVTGGELLDELLAYSEVNIKPTTAHVWNCTLMRTCALSSDTSRRRHTTAKLQEYRRKRVAAGRSEATANRELSILRTALNRGRKCTPPKVLMIPYFPMVAETNVRQGFLTDEQYARLRDELPEYVRPRS